MTNTDNGLPPQYRIEKHRIAVTFFDDFTAKTRRQEELTLPALAGVIQSENRIEKRRLPWLKLGVFGDNKTKKGSLRHDANMLRITGVEVEHDAGKVTFDQATELMIAAGIRCLIYTSPSHMVPDEHGTAVEKWRILAPTSEPLPPAERYALAARINGVLKGAATWESFTLSQSYFFGSVKHNPEHRVTVVDSDYFVDLCDDLDEGAIGAPEKVRKARGRPADEAPGHKPEDIDAMLEHCRVHMRDPDNEKGWRERMLKVTASLVSKLWTDDAIREKCGPSCTGGKHDRDLDTLIRTARERFDIPNPVEDLELGQLLGGLRDDAEAEGIRPEDVGPAYRKPRKPVIRLGQLNEMVDQAALALIAADVSFYQRGGALVRPVVLPVQTFKGAPSFSAQLVAVTAHYMRDTLSRQISWVRYDKKAHMWMPANPPMEVALTLLDKFGDWDFRVLAGIITTQTLRPDGSILAEEGYDPSTQLLLINPPVMAAIPARPTRHDAERALKLLCDLLDEFPFVEDVEDVEASLSRAVGLSAIVSTVCRGAYPVVPMHVIDAPAAGTGKSYLLSTVSRITTGQPMPVMSAGKTVEETEKRLGAAVIAGQTLICIDNVEGELGGDALCQVVEQVRPSVRILGQSKLIEVDGRSMCLFANGNNISLVGDIYRRVVICRLDAKLERPEKRQFERDPEAMVLADRGRYVAACLTIVRAYQAAGRPDRRPQIASFNEWSDAVRSALVWLGEADCVETMDNARAEDPYRLAQEALLAEWRDVFVGRGVALRDVVAKCEETIAGGGERGAMRFAYNELRLAVIATNPVAHRKGIDPNALGQRMRSYKDQWVNGMRFTKAERGQTVLWYAEVKRERPAAEVTQDGVK